MTNFARVCSFLVFFPYLQFFSGASRVFPCTTLGTRTLWLPRTVWQRCNFYQKVPSTLDKRVECIMFAYKSCLFVVYCNDYTSTACSNIFVEVVKVDGASCKAFHLALMMLVLSIFHSLETDFRRIGCLTDSFRYTLASCLGPMYRTTSFCRRLGRNCFSMTCLF